MIKAAGHPEPMTISGRLRQRLSELEVAVVSIRPDGTSELISPHRWEHVTGAEARPTGREEKRLRVVKFGRVCLLS